MKRGIHAFVTAIVLVGGAAVAAPPGPSERCDVSGGGQIGSDTSFAGSVRSTGAGDADGTWTHVGTVVVRVTDVAGMTCSSDGGGGPGQPDGQNLADIDATGSFNGLPGYTIRLHGEDRGEGVRFAGEPPEQSRDVYAIRVFDQLENLVYSASEQLASGNIQIRPAR